MKRARGFAVGVAEIEKARLFLADVLAPTPLLLNPWLSEEFGCEVYLKLENMQPIGSFKIRGATYRISRLTEKERRRGVIAASAGNHAQGVAWGARRMGVDSLIVMPAGASLTKIHNTKRLGAAIHLEGETFDDATAVARKIARKTGRTFVHAYEDEAVIAGAGTIGLEILDQLPSVDCVVGALGGGGMLGGVSTAIKELKPKVRIVGCQSSGAASLVESLRKGRAVQSRTVDTFADGVAIRTASDRMRRLLAPRLDRVLTTDDESIAAAVLSLMEKAKTVAEGAGALPLAALDQLRGSFRGRKVVLIVSGGNIDVNVLSRIVDRGLIRAGRRLRVNCLISDRPGSLSALTGLLGRAGASIIQAIHDRNEPATRIDQTDVALTLETRGPEHSRQVVEALKKAVLRLEIVH